MFQQWRSDCGTGVLRAGQRHRLIALVDRTTASRIQLLSAAQRFSNTLSQKQLRASSLSQAAKLRLASLTVAAAGTHVVKASEVAGRGGGDKTIGDFGHPARRMTDIMLALNIAIYGLQMLTKPRLLLWGAKVNPLIDQGQWYRLMTSTCLHGNLMHLFFNCRALADLGPILEMQSGRARFAVIYVVSALAGSLFSYWRSPSISVGASGAIFGLGSALALTMYRHRDRHQKLSEVIIKSLGQSLLINAVIGWQSTYIDNWGHVGGFVGGLIASFLFGPNFRQDQFGRIRDSPPLRLLAAKP